MTRRRIDLDLDVHRGAAESFGHGSLVDGALLPHAGREFLRRPDGPPPTVCAATADGWAGPSVPVLVRGAARIVPLAWRGDVSRGGGTGVSAEEVEAYRFAIEADGMQWAGYWHMIDLEAQPVDRIGEYATALRNAGGTRAERWVLSPTLGAVLVWAGDVDRGDASLALHIVPADWVSDVSWVTRNRGPDSAGDIDVRWSWADVIALTGEPGSPTT